MAYKWPGGLKKTFPGHLLKVTHCGHLTSLGNRETEKARNREAGSRLLLDLEFLHDGAVLDILLPLLQQVHLGLLHVLLDLLIVLEEQLRDGSPEALRVVLALLETTGPAYPGDPVGIHIPALIVGPLHGHAPQFCYTGTILLMAGLRTMSAGQARSFGSGV